MKTKFLGKNNKKLNKSGKNLLDSITRIRENIRFGIDIWNVYDFMYLDINKVPHLVVLEIIIPSNSDLIIESKSMKLYLNHFYNKTYRTKNDILKIIKKDIETKIKSKIKVKFLTSFSIEPNTVNLNSLKSKLTPAKKILKFNGFRSICPVTSQPDFANIYIYSGNSIDTDWIINYLISYKDHGDFHEKCIDQIFKDVMAKYPSNHLEICGRFQRRGGIDINPIRGTHKRILFGNFREFNQ